MICLTLWDEWGNYFVVEMGTLGGGTFDIWFNDETFFVSLFCLLIYWVLWGHKK